MAQAAWRKYPNPMNPAVIGTDVVDRKVINGVLHSHRLVGSTWYFPRWAQSVSRNTRVLNYPKFEMLLKLNERCYLRKNDNK